MGKEMVILSFLSCPLKSEGASQVVKNPPANAGDTSSIPGWGRSPGEGDGIFGNFHGENIPTVTDLKLPIKLDAILKF